MTSGEMRAEWDADLRRKAAAAKRDLDNQPRTLGYTGHLDPKVSRYLYAMRDLGVTGPAGAADVLDALDGAQLTEQQQAELLAAIKPPVAE